MKSIFRATGHVELNRMKPRDHAMYYLSEETNLRSHDEKKLDKTRPYTLFDRQILSSPTARIQSGKTLSTSAWGESLTKGKVNYAALNQLLQISIQKNGRAK